MNRQFTSKSFCLELAQTKLNDDAKGGIAAVLAASSSCEDPLGAEHRPQRESSMVLDFGGRRTRFSCGQRRPTSKTQVLPSRIVVPPISLHTGVLPQWKQTSLGTQPRVITRIPTTSHNGVNEAIPTNVRRTNFHANGFEHTHSAVPAFCFQTAIARKVCLHIGIRRHEQQTSILSRERPPEKNSQKSEYLQVWRATRSLQL